MNKIKLLDHGYISLVEHMGSDFTISSRARLSYDSTGREEDIRLINYLYKNGHNTPFEAVVFTFEVKAPIFTFRQWHRHRTQSYNELSARYRELPEEFYIPEPELIGVQNKDNKQMRDFESMTPERLEMNVESCAIMQSQNESAFTTYRILIERGVPRELARSVLPFGTYSVMSATVNLNNLFKFMAERSHIHAQHEIRVYSNAMMELIRPIVPIALGAFESGLGDGYV